MKLLIESWKKYLKESNNNNILSIEHLDNIAKIAQQVYDNWKQDEEGYSEDYDVGYGGICHIIADKIVDYLYSQADLQSKHNFCSVSSNFEQHVYVIAWKEIEPYEEDEFEEEKLYDLYSIDIPYYVYETGGGFNWKKIEGVQFSGSDVVISLIERYVKESDLEQYLEN